MYNILKTASRRAKRTTTGGKSGIRRLDIYLYIGRTRGDLLSSRGMSGNRQRCPPSTEPWQKDTTSGLQLLLMTGGDRRGLPVGSAGTTRGLRAVWVVSSVQAKRAVWPLYVTATEDWNCTAPNPYHPHGVYPHRQTFPPDGDRLFCDCSITE